MLWSLALPLLDTRVCHQHHPATGPLKLRTLPMADSTTQGRYWGKLQMMSATSRMRSASRTDEPPNLYTTLTCVDRGRSRVYACRLHCFACCC